MNPYCNVPREQRGMQPLLDEFNADETLVGNWAANLLIYWFLYLSMLSAAAAADPGAQKESPALQVKETGVSAFRNVKVYAEPGRFGGWPANHGLWSWGNEILVGFSRGYYKDLGPELLQLDSGLGVHRLLDCQRMEMERLLEDRYLAVIPGIDVDPEGPHPRSEGAGDLITRQVLPDRA